MHFLIRNNTKYDISLSLSCRSQPWVVLNRGYRTHWSGLPTVGARLFPEKFKMNRDFFYILMIEGFETYRLIRYIKSNMFFLTGILPVRLPATKSTHSLSTQPVGSNGMGWKQSKCTSNQQQQRSLIKSYQQLPTAAKSTASTVRPIKLSLEPTKHWCQQRKGFVSISQWQR